MSQQQTFLLERGDKFALTRRMRSCRRLVNDRRMSLEPIARLLEVIEVGTQSDGACHKLQDALAAAYGRDSRTWRRNLRLAEELGLVNVSREQRGDTCSLAIDWDQVRRMIGDQSSQQHPAPAGPVHRPSSGQTGTGHSSEGPDIQAKDRTLCPVGTGHYVRSHNKEVSPTIQSNGLNPKPNQPMRASSPAPDGLVGLCEFGKSWGRPVTDADVRDAYTLDALFDEALERRLVHESDRLRFFTLARFSKRRQREGAIGSAAGCLAGNVLRRRWYGSNEDEQFAAQALRDLAAEPE